MLRQVLHFLTAWRWSTVQQQQPMSAIDTCIFSAEIHVPCTPTPTNAEAQCLCAQYLWRALCFSNHDVESSPTFGHRNTVEEEMNSYCEAAGSSGAEVKRSYKRDRRQVQSAISSQLAAASSIAGIFNSVPIETPPVSAPPIVSTAANLEPTPQIKSSDVPVNNFIPSVTGVITSAANSAVAPTTATLHFGSTTTPAVVPTATNPTSEPTNKASDTSTPQASSSNSHSGPSAGLIAGAVIGSIAVLVLVGILIMLILRYKKKDSNNPQNSHSGEQGAVEKEVHHGETQGGMYKGSELSTTANRWELEGQGPSAWELEAAHTHHQKDAKPEYLAKN